MSTSIEISTKLQYIIHESQSLNSFHKAIQICTDNNLKKYFSVKLIMKKLIKFFMKCYLIVYSK